MAPNRVAQAKRQPKSNQFLFDLGVRGRKTGLTLPDTGVRDENGLEPLDGLFSSPAKPQVNGFSNKTMSSDDMEMGGSSIPEPEEVLEQRASFRLPPRSKSPIKTFLHSPARKNPSFGAVSSPARGSIVAPRAASVSTSVVRKLNFSNNQDDSTDPPLLTKKRAESALPSTIAAAKFNAGTHHLPPLDHDESTDMERTGDYREEADDSALEVDMEDSFQMVDVGIDEGEGEIEIEDEYIAQEEEEPEPENELEPEREPVPEKKGKRKATEAGMSENLAKNPRGRPRKDGAPVDEEESERPTKRTRRSLEQAQAQAAEPAKKQRASKTKATVGDELPPGPEPDVEEELLKKPPGRPRKLAASEDAAPSKKKAGKAQNAAKGVNETKKATKPTGKKPKLAPAKKLASIQETNSPHVKAGPPMPRNNRGLVILRRETPGEGPGFKQTRSGRNSIKPLAYWKNERVEFDQGDEYSDGALGKFLLPKIKEVVRADEVEEPRPKRLKPHYKKPSKTTRRIAEPESETEELMEPWETDGGHQYGHVRVYRPDDPQGLHEEEAEEELALASAAIITQVVEKATFKFAKTLTLPFFGSGMVDLPPGTAKKPKNSRRMQMVFFVHYGRVRVTVNETEFRIGKGGMWQVPRGNFYSIENDYDVPARIFFSQGCAVPEAEE